ncbi:MAG: hypothetical protein KBF33_07850 [Comamonas sp.]|nr:hypothetical protein [Comamonas sp.]
MQATHSPLSHQRGVTLISLMVGLMISMVVVLATLMLFQRTVRATTAARSDAKADAQRSAAFLSASIAIQEAGYGIDAAQADSHLVVLTDATLENSTFSGELAAQGDSGNAVVWAENTTGTLRCSALLAPRGEGQGGLLKLGPVACADAVSFADLDWTNQALSTSPAEPVTITWQAAECSPFGIGASIGTNKVFLTLSAPNSNGVSLQTSQCLLNISAP